MHVTNVNYLIVAIIFIIIIITSLGKKFKDMIYSFQLLND